MNYGSDLYLDENGDIEFTLSGDIRTESGPRLIAQDIREEIETSLGSLPWSPSSGSSLWSALNDTEINDDDVIHELERIALSDPRVDASTARATRVGDGKFRLIFTPIGSPSEEALLFDTSNDKESPV